MNKKVVKYCKEHGEQKADFSFCPRCAAKLLEKVWITIEDLPQVEEYESFAKRKAFYEARGTAWGAIGIPGVVAFKLASSSITPKELQKLLETHKLTGIGPSALSAINRLSEQDYLTFEKTLSELQEETAWPWKLGTWAEKNRYNYTNGEYMNLKAKFIKTYERKKEGIFELKYRRVIIMLENIKVSILDEKEDSEAMKILNTAIKQLEQFTE